MNEVPSDIEIAQVARLRAITDVALELGLADDEVISFGSKKAKVRLDAPESYREQNGLRLPSRVSLQDCSSIGTEDWSEAWNL